MAVSVTLHILCQLITGYLTLCAHKAGSATAGVVPSRYILSAMHISTCRLFAGTPQTPACNQLYVTFCVAAFPQDFIRICWPRRLRLLLGQFMFSETLTHAAAQATQHCAGVSCNCDHCAMTRSCTCDCGKIVHIRLWHVRTGQHESLEDKCGWFAGECNTVQP